MHASRSFGLVLIAAIGLSPAVARAGGGAESDPADVNCRAVSTRAMQSLLSTLQNAYSAAQADARQNGTNGEYAVAANYSRNQIKTALDRAAAMLANHNSADPRTTTYAEGGTVKEYTRSILEGLPQAAHWATVSNIYHDSDDARRAFDGAASALDQTRTLWLNASNCYMDGYTS